MSPIASKAYRRMAKPLLGKPIAERILHDVKTRIAESGVRPGLAVILVGDDAPSELYVSLKERAAQEVGIGFERIELPPTTTKEELFACIDALNARDDIHGIIVQLPLPPGLPTDDIITRIDPRKDTDGFHKETLRRFLRGDRDACPVFPRAVVELLRSSGEPLRDEYAVVIVNSELLGEVMAQALRLEGLDAEYVLSLHASSVLAEMTRQARVVVTACGSINSLKGAMLDEDAIVIDGGISRFNGKVVGDCDPKTVSRKVAYYSPVPGGVGPVTVATLLARVTDAALSSSSSPSSS